MKPSSKKTWDLIKRLNNDPTQKPTIPTVTPNQIAHNLLINGKIKAKKPRLSKLKNIRCKKNENRGLGGTFSDIELEAAMALLKNGKATGIDDMHTEQIRHFGTITKRWLLDFFNNIRKTLKLPKVWRKAKARTLPK